MLRKSLKIFISYRRDDAPGHAGRLSSDLIREFGQRHVFLDIDTIEIGADFIEVLENAVNSADVLIAVIGREWLRLLKESERQESREDYVRLEIAAGLRQNLRVIPVLVEGTQIPRLEELPNDLKSLIRRNAIEISDTRWRYDVNQLITAIKKMPRRNSSTAQSLMEKIRAIHLSYTQCLDSRFSKISGKTRVVIICLLIIAVISLWALPLLMRQYFSVSDQETVNSNQNNENVNTSNINTASALTEKMSDQNGSQSNAQIISSLENKTPPRERNTNNLMEVSSSKNTSIASKLSSTPSPTPVESKEDPTSPKFTGMPEPRIELEIASKLEGDDMKNYMESRWLAKSIYDNYRVYPDAAFSAANQYVQKYPTGSYLKYANRYIEEYKKWKSMDK